MSKEVVDNTSSKMVKTVEAIKHELSAVRTGKASASLLDNVRVMAYGTETPLSQVASITSPDVRLLVVQPWDKTLVGDVVKGLQAGDLGLNPIADGDVIRIPIPSLNEERRKELVKHAKKMVEDGKVAIRNVRRDANDHLKKEEKDKTLTSDLMHDAMNQIQELTDKYCSELDKMGAAKEKEVMEV